MAQASSSSNADMEQTGRDSAQTHANISAYRSIPNVEILGESSNASMLHFETTDTSAISLARNEHGHTTLHLASAQLLGSVSDIVSNYTASEAVVLLRETTTNEGLSSLHISTMCNHSDIVDYILGMINDDQERRDFINQVDRQLGWTSLQWGAALDNVPALEATMNHMTIDHQTEVMTTGWTLLHATAVTSAVNSMRSLMARFESDGNLKWNILTCPLVGGQTPLHIAVTEGQARAAIVLLELAGENRHELAQRVDNSGMTAHEYSSAFPLLGGYLELATEFTEPVLHLAARQGNHLLVSWILEKNHLGHELEEINRKSEGLTVLQVAAVADNVAVIEQIAHILSPSDLLRSLTTFSDNGETALHIAAANNHTAVVHALLYNASKEHRPELLSICNTAGETALEVAEKLHHSHIVNILKYHHLVLSAEGLLEFFKQFQFSLFSVELTHEQVKVKYKRIEDNLLEDGGLLRHVNYDTAICLLYGDLSKADDLIVQAFNADSEKSNVHTWCNKGMLVLMRDPLLFEEAERIAYKILEIISLNPVVYALQAKIDFAYWNAEYERSEEACESCCKILAECQAQVNYSPEMQEYFSYAYLTTLIRQVRSVTRYKHPNDWIQRKLLTAVEQLIMISKSNRDEYKGDMWIWLAELQSTRISDDFLKGPLQLFRSETGIDSIDMESCNNYAYELSATSVTLEHKRTINTRIAKNCLYFAYTRKSNLKEREHWLNNALDLSEKWMANNYWLYMCASTAAQALVNIWAIRFYEKLEQLSHLSAYGKHDELLKKQYQMYHGVPLDGACNYIEYIAAYFYSRDIGQEECTRKYLGQSKQHLVELIKHDGWVAHGVKYGRVKYLLGDQWEEVQHIFQKAIDECETEIYRVMALEHYGYCCLVEEKYKLAKEILELAVQKNREIESNYDPSLAHAGLENLNQQGF